MLMGGGVCAGAMAGRSDVLAAVRSMHNVLGGTLDPHAAYLLLRGLKTLDLRVSRQNTSAMEVSRRLEAHPKVGYKAQCMPSNLISWSP